MKHLKNTLITVLIVATAITAQAQTFGLRGGMNLSNMLMKYEDEVWSEDFKMNPGYHVGLAVDVPIDKWLSFESGLLLSTKGYKYSEEGDGYKAEEKLNLLYLNIPLTPKATINTGKVKLYAIAGPYLSIGLSGKSKSTYTYNGNTETNSEKIDWGTDGENDDLKRLDFGLSMGGGVLINALQIGVTYDLGISNILPEAPDNVKIKNRVLGVTCAYWFNKK